MKDPKNTQYILANTKDTEILLRNTQRKTFFPFSIEEDCWDFITSVLMYYLIL